jgi:hypothetical protein
MDEEDAKPDKMLEQTTDEDEADTTRTDGEGLPEDIELMKMKQTPQERTEKVYQKTLELNQRRQHNQEKPKISTSSIITSKPVY